MLGIRIVPAVKLVPINSFVEAIKTNLVIRAEESSLGIFQSGSKWDLLPSPLMENTEQSQTRDEQGYERENPS